MMIVVFILILIVTLHKLLSLEQDMKQESPIVNHWAIGRAKYDHTEKIRKDRRPEQEHFSHDEPHELLCTPRLF